jgi:hypothetical protein
MKKVIGSPSGSDALTLNVIRTLGTALMVAGSPSSPADDRPADNRCDVDGRSGEPEVAVNVTS